MTRKAHPCPECAIETESTHAGLYHCDNGKCPVATFKTDFYGVPHSITYCADIEEKGRKGW